VAHPALKVPWWVLLLLLLIAAEVLRRRVRARQLAAMDREKEDLLPH
jgi:hypothetical protein